MEHYMMDGCDPMVEFCWPGYHIMGNKMVGHNNIMSNRGMTSDVSNTMKSNLMGRQHMNSNVMGRDMTPNMMNRNMLGQQEMTPNMMYIMMDVSNNQMSSKLMNSPLSDILNPNSG